MRDTTFIVTVLGALGVVLFAVATRLSKDLVRARARRLPMRIAGRMEEEWLGELDAITSRPGKLAFAIALTLTGRHAFAAPGDDSVHEIDDRPLGRFAAFSGRKPLLIFPTALFAIAAYGASFLLPVRYASESLILIRPERLSTEFASDMIDFGVVERNRLILQTVTSRSARLEILRVFPELKIGHETWSTDRMLEELQKDIAVRFTPSPAGTNSQTFRVQYIDADPEHAQKVASKLTQSFLDASRRNQGFKPGGTGDVLYRQLNGQLDALFERLHGELTSKQAALGPEAGRERSIDYELRSAFGTLRAMAIAMEQEQKGETFMVLDPAGWGTPVVPNRMAIAGIGAFTGLVLGGMAVIGLSRRQRRALA